MLSIGRLLISRTNTMHPFVQQYLLRQISYHFKRLINVQTMRIFSNREATRSQPITCAKPITIFVATRQEILVYANEMQLLFNVRTITLLDRLERGNKVILALQGTLPIAMLWMAFNDQYISEVGSLLELRSDEFVTFNAVTLPPWRNMGLSTALNRAAYAHAVELNRPVQLAWRSTRNHQALRVASKLGQTPVGDMTAVWLCGYRIWHRRRNYDGACISLDNRRNQA
jgi:hypothetical protein